MACFGALGSFFARFFLPSVPSPPASGVAFGRLGAFAGLSPAALGVLGALVLGAFCERKAWSAAMHSAWHARSGACAVR